MGEANAWHPRKDRKIQVGKIDAFRAVFSKVTSMNISTKIIIKATNTFGWFNNGQSIIKRQFLKFSSESILFLQRFQKSHSPKNLAPIVNITKKDREGRGTLNSKKIERATRCGRNPQAVHNPLSNPNAGLMNFMHRMLIFIDYQCNVCRAKLNVETIV